MSYLGAKAKCSSHILEVLNDPIFDDMDYVEPMVGYGHVLRRVENKRSYRASDCNPLLITLMQAIQKRRKLPKITRNEYYVLKEQTRNSLRRAVAAFTYSYCGKEFGGFVDKYVRDGIKKSYAEERKRYYSSLQENESFMMAKLRCVDYRRLHYKNKLIYCDPPYANTTTYMKNNETNDFDSAEFWQVMREWSKDNYVFISEYKAPKDFKCVASADKQSTLSTKERTTRREKLFVHRSVYDRIGEISD